MEGWISFHKFTTFLIQSAAEQMLASIKNALSKINPFKLKNALAQPIPPIPQHVLIPTMQQHDHSLLGKIPVNFKFQMTQHLERLSNLEINKSLFPMKLSSLNNSFYNQPILARQRCFLNSSNFFQFSKKKNSPPKGNKPQQPQEDKFKLIQKNIVDLVKKNNLEGLVKYIWNGEDLKQLSTVKIFKLIENIRLYEKKNVHLFTMANIFLMIEMLSKLKTSNPNLKKPKNKNKRKNKSKRSINGKTPVTFEEILSSINKQYLVNFISQMNILSNLSDLELQTFNQTVKIILRSQYSKQLVDGIQACLKSPLVSQSDLFIGITDKVKNIIMLQRNSNKGKQRTLEEVKKLTIMLQIQILTSKKLNKQNKIAQLTRIKTLLEELNLGNHGANPILEAWKVVRLFISWLNQHNNDLNR